MNTIETLGVRASCAKRSLAVTSGTERNNALYAIADALEANSEYIIAQNALDMESGRANSLSLALLDRLRLDKDRVHGIAESMRDVALLPDPLSRILQEHHHANGMLIQKVSVPLGVIAVIFEARPNVTADSAALCLKSGNVVILRGGKEAIRSNTAIACVMRKAAAACGLDENCIQLVEDTSRESADALMRLNAYVDLLIPRGGAGLIQSVVKNATVPVIETGAGTCHVYVDKAADVNMASDIIYNAKTSRPSVCNACECMLIHVSIAQRALPAIKARLDEKNVEIRGDAATKRILPDIEDADPSDWGREYGDYIIACKVVSGIDEALEHIQLYGTGHSECIVTADQSAADRFLDAVDAAAVYHNASTRFTDGGEFGLGAEIGISTQKLHARGPLGLNELTTVKYRIRGSGQIR